MLLTTNGDAKLADFGLGAMHSHYMDEEFDGTSVQIESFGGTANFAAPEVFLGRQYAGAPADIWSLGLPFLFCPTSSRQ